MARNTEINDKVEPFILKDNRRGQPQAAVDPWLQTGKQAAAWTMDRTTHGPHRLQTPSLSGISTAIIDYTLKQVEVSTMLKRTDELNGVEWFGDTMHMLPM